MDLLWRLEAPAQGELTGLTGIYGSAVLWRKEVVLKYNTNERHPGPSQDWIEHGGERHRMDRVATPDHLFAFEDLERARSWFFDSMDMPLFDESGVKLVAIRVSDVCEIHHGSHQSIFRLRYKRDRVPVPSILRPETETYMARVAKGYRRAHLSILDLHTGNDDTLIQKAIASMEWEPEKVG